MSRPSWRDRLRQATANRPSRIAIVGVGHELRGDDAAGVMVARGLRSSERVLVIDAGPAPESFAAHLHDFSPDLVLFVDAVQMNQPPGAIDWIEYEQITGVSASTHTLPLDVLAHYLTLDTGCVVTLIGIQPAATDLGAALSPEVERAVHELVRHLNDAFGADGSLSQVSVEFHA